MDTIFVVFSTACCSGFYYRTQANRDQQQRMSAAAEVYNAQEAWTKRCADGGVDIHHHVEKLSSEDELHSWEDVVEAVKDDGIAADADCEDLIAFMLDEDRWMDPEAMPKTI